MNTSVDFRERLEGIEDLPTLPVVVDQLHRLIANPRSNMSQIATVIARDQAIAGRVIKLVNSAFYGLSRRVTSIQQAIVILGLTTVKNLTLGVSVVKTFGACEIPSIFDREKFWLHSFGCAQAAKMIARHLRRDEPEDYFLAGLLHDIGILVEDQFLHEEFVQVLKQTVGSSVSLTEAEESVMGMTHPEVGEFIARRWKLPDFVVQSMRFHHPVKGMGPDSSDYPDFVSVIHAADTLVWNAGVGRFCRELQPGSDESALQNLGFSPKIIDEVTESVRSSTAALAREWGI